MPRRSSTSDGRRGDEHVQDEGRDAAAEIERLRRFGERRTHARGERLVTSGEVSQGLFVILSGEVLVSQHKGAHVIATIHAFLTRERAADRARETARVARR